MQHWHLDQIVRWNALCLPMGGHPKLYWTVVVWWLLSRVTCPQSASCLRVCAWKCSYLLRHLYVYRNTYFHSWEVKDGDQLHNRLTVFGTCVCYLIIFLIIFFYTRSNIFSDFYAVFSVWTLEIFNEYHYQLRKSIFYDQI